MIKKNFYLYFITEKLDEINLDYVKKTGANLILRKKTIRKIVGEPIWEKLYTHYKIDDNFDKFLKLIS